MNLLQQLESSVRIHRDKPSLMVKREGTYQSITYGELWQSIERFSTALHRLGVQAGDKVGLLSTNRPEWPISDYSILALKAVVVPIYPTLPDNQVQFILNNADVKFVIVEDEAQLAKILSAWPEKLQAAICMDMDNDPMDSRIYRFQSLFDLFEDPQPISASAIAENELATIVHTSGTSGKPKGVMLSHRNITSNVEASLTYFTVLPSDVALSYLPLSHIFERTVGQYALLSRGATIAYAESIETIQQNLLEVRPTVLVSVPRLLEKVYSGIQEKLNHLPPALGNLLRKPIAKQAPHGIAFYLLDRLVYKKLRKGLGGRLRAVISGGAGLAEDIAVFYILGGIPVYEGYGMTESAPVICVNPEDHARPGTVGVPVPGVEVQVADDGELLVRGPNVMLGYYRQPDETAKTITDGWLHTGDIAELVDGYVKIVDRKKNILVLATGKNVAPWPVESAITLQPAIASAVLIGDGRKYVTAILVPDFAAMKSFLDQHNLTGDPESLVAEPLVREHIRQAVLAAMTGFADFEQPKRAIVLPHDFTVDSGDLTPTLKVRNQIILRKYAREIDAMYEGKAYLTVMGDPAEEPPASVASIEEVPAAAEPSPVAEIAVKTQPSAGSRLGSVSKHVGKGTLLVAALAVVALGALAASPPKNLDLLGMIHHIGQNTNQLNGVNGHIVNTMQSISHQAGKTGTIQTQMGSLKSGVIADESSLSNLNGLSLQENNLSKQFLTVADGLVGSLGQIGSASSTQDQSLSHLASLANGIGQDTQRLVAVNQTIQGKLAAARGKTDTLAREMP